LLVKRPAEPRASVPALTLTEVTSAVPLRFELAVTVIAPAPRLAATVPPPKAYVTAVSLPEPASEPLVIAKLETVSVELPRSRLPPATVTAVESARTFEAP